MDVYENLDVNDLDGELWKQIENFPDYEVSNLGRVKSFKRNKVSGQILRQKKDKDGYLDIGLCKNGKKFYKTHRLILKCFNPIKNMTKLQVNHINQISNSPIIKKLKISQKEIAEVFGISQTLISKIKLKKIWLNIRDII